MRVMKKKGNEGKKQESFRHQDGLMDGMSFLQDDYTDENKEFYGRGLSPKVFRC